MTSAQDLKVGNAVSGAAGILLESVASLLQDLVPRCGLFILLFDDTELGPARHWVCSLAPTAEYPAWLGRRAPGQAVFMPTIAELPRAIADKLPGGPDFTKAVAVPLVDPAAPDAGIGDAREAGLVFVLADAAVDRDDLLQLGAKLSRFVTHRWQVHRDLDRKIHVDALTGLFNRGFLDNHCPVLLERARRSETPLTLIMADIDLFKSINTEFGLLVGDRALQMIARRLQEELRRVDVVCRRGGEEFALMLPETGPQAAREVITRLLHAPFVLPAGPDTGNRKIQLTMSYGVSIFPDDGSNYEQLHNHAQSLMFLSRDRGRNQCQYWRNDGNHRRQLP